MDVVIWTRAHRIVVTVVAVAQMWISTAGLVLGTPATPSSEATPTCDVAARTPDQITALLAGPEIATPAPTTDGQILPAGAPADADTAATMEHIVNLWLACQNAG